MPVEPERLLRSRLTDLADSAPQVVVSLDAVVVRGRRSRRRRRSFAAVTAAALVVLAGAGAVVAGHVGRGDAPATLTTSPAPSAPAVTFSDRVGRYVVNYVPVAHLGTRGAETLSFRSGACIGSPEDAATSRSTVGCWSPRGCPPTVGPAADGRACDAGLVLVVDEPGPLASEHPGAGTAVGPPVNVRGRPGVTTAATDGTTRTIAWILPDGLVAGARATGVTAADLQKFADGVLPATLARPAPTGPLQTSTTGLAACEADRLHAAPAETYDPIAGEQGLDVPIYADAACRLSLADLTVAFDPAVPVRPTGTTAVALAAGTPVYLDITGEADGYCPGRTPAKRATVSYRTTNLRTLQVGAPGICTSAAVTLETRATTGQTPTCAAAGLGATVGPADTGNGTQQVDVLLRNTGAKPCQLGGYPIAVSGVTADGTVVDLHANADDTSANGVVLIPGRQAFVGVGGLPARACADDLAARPRRPGTYPALRLTLGGGAVRIGATGTPFAFPCGPVGTTAFQPPPGR